jgi:hypothetical protein
MCIKTTLSMNMCYGMHWMCPSDRLCDWDTSAILGSHNHKFFGDLACMSSLPVRSICRLRANPIPWHFCHSSTRCSHTTCINLPVLDEAKASANCCARSINVSKPLPNWNSRNSYRVCSHLTWFHRFEYRYMRAVACRGGGGLKTLPPSQFRCFAKAQPNSQFRGKYIRNNLIRIWVSLICKLSITPD